MISQTNLKIDFDELHKRTFLEFLREPFNSRLVDNYRIFSSRLPGKSVQSAWHSNYKFTQYGEELQITVEMLEEH